MSKNVFGNSSNISEKELIHVCTCLFVQKTYLRIIYVESNIEDYRGLKIHKRNKIFSDPISIREAALKTYFDKNFNDPSILTKTPLILVLLIKISKMFALSK